MDGIELLSNPQALPQLRALSRCALRRTASRQVTAAGRLLLQERRAQFSIGAIGKSLRHVWAGVRHALWRRVAISVRITRVGRPALSGLRGLHGAALAGEDFLRA